MAYNSFILLQGNPQQNSKAERLNQTINNCAKTMLNAANLSLQFWDSAILCASHLYNCTPHSGINNKIPNEIFFNKPIDITHFKVFGCRVYFFNNHKSNKFENNSKPGIFLGYSNNSTGYQVLDLSTNSIINARDAYFIEDIPGTLQTPFFSSKVVDSFFDTSNLSIEGEVSTNTTTTTTTNINNNNYNNNINNNNSTNNNNNDNQSFTTYNNSSQLINNNNNSNNNYIDNNFNNSNQQNNQQNKNNSDNNMDEDNNLDDNKSILSEDSESEPLITRKQKLM